MVIKFQKKLAYYPPKKYNGSVLDGRDWKTRDNEITIDYEKMQKRFHRMFDTLSYIFYTSFWLYVTYAVFMICTNSFLLPLSYVVFMIANELITLLI